MCVYSPKLVSGIRNPILNDFRLDKPSVKKIFKNPIFILYKVNKQKPKLIKFYCEDDEENIVKFNGETKTSIFLSKQTEYYLIIEFSLCNMYKQEKKSRVPVKLLPIF